MNTSYVRPAIPVRFVSDVHITWGDSPGRDAFNRFLEDCATSGVRTLFIHGDLFEFWIGDRQGKFAFYRPLFDALRTLTASGTAVHLLKGNRDFLLGRAFEDAGCHVVEEELELELGGLKTHLSHGDELCLDDRSYQRARKVFRSKVVAGIAWCLPAGLGVLLARSYRGISERKKRRMKSAEGHRYHTIRRGVEELLRRGGYDALICGHIHWPKEQVVEVDAKTRRVITTGAWEEGPNYVEFDGESLALKVFRPAL